MPTTATLSGRYVLSTTGIGGGSASDTLTGRYVLSTTGTGGGSASDTLTGRYVLSTTGAGGGSVDGTLIGRYLLSGIDPPLSVHIQSTLTARYDQEFTKFNSRQSEIARVAYQCTLTNGANSTVVKISTIQMRTRLQDPETVMQSVTLSIPSEEQIAVVTPFLSASTVIGVVMIAYYRDGTSAQFTLAEAAYKDIRVNAGWQNRTASLSALSYGAPSATVVYTPFGVQTYSGNEVDSANIRCAPQFGLAAGMTVFYDNKYWVAEELTYNIGDRSAYMDITLVA